MKKLVRYLKKYKVCYWIAKNIYRIAYKFLCLIRNIIIRIELFLFFMIFDRSDTLTVLCCQGIGDSLITAFFLNQLKTDRHIRRLVIICKEGHRDIFESYKCIDRLVCNSGLAEYLYSECIKENYKKKINFINSALQQVPPEKRMDTVINGYFTKVLKLSGEKRIEYPKVVIERKRNKENFIDKDTIIILPYAYSSEELLPDLWIAIVDRLIGLNFKVLTNIGHNSREKPIQGTKPYHSSLSELFVYAKESYAVIGIRSGVLDWLACSGCNLLCIDNVWGGLLGSKYFFYQSS